VLPPKWNHTKITNFRIPLLFLEAPDDEKQHAKRFFNLLQGGEAMTPVSYPAGVGGDTLAQLKAAAGERHEWTTLQLSFADDAIQEGFRDVAEHSPVNDIGPG
jgi:rubrerythrin